MSLGLSAVGLPGAEERQQNSDAIGAIVPNGEKSPRALIRKTLLVMGQMSLNSAAPREAVELQSPGRRAGPLIFMNFLFILKFHRSAVERWTKEPGRDVDSGIPTG
jgi:hypothetical protein